MTKEVNTCWKLDDNTFFKQKEDFVLAVRHLDEVDEKDYMIIRRRVDHITNLEKFYKLKFKPMDDWRFESMLKTVKTKLIHDE